jgi:hypothetical protein
MCKVGRVNEFGAAGIEDGQLDILRLKFCGSGSHGLSIPGFNITTKKLF